MDIFSIIKNLGSENISVLINALSKLFSPSQNDNPNPPSPPPETKSFDLSNPYWSLPNYAQNVNNSSTMQNKNQCIVHNNSVNNTNFYDNTQKSNQSYSQQQNYQSADNQQQTNQNGANFIEILKVLLPLFTQDDKNATPIKAENKSVNSGENFEILKLKKTKDT